jgi:cytochrome c oxidase subunit 2
VATISGCGGKQSTVNPSSGQASQVADLWWAMLGAATIVFLGAIALLTIAARRRKREGFPLVGQKEGFSNRLVITFGIVIPVVALVPLFAVANVSKVLPATSAPKPGSTSMTIQVIGHQWFWEVRYPGTPAVTANEIHIPARTRVNVVATTADVIHSFWVPALNRKIDEIPGRDNRVLLYADKPGIYRGQCAEYCGFQHAHMALYVFADPPAKFRAWLANMAAPARPPATAAEKAGQQVFMSSQCASCHTIRGSGAIGAIGPDLTHLQSRSTLAALTIPNRKGYLAGWILDPQHIKPGNRMPGLNLTGPQMTPLLSYLESLR